MRRFFCLLAILVCLAAVVPAQADGWTAWGQGQGFTVLAATPDGSTMYAGGGAWLGRSTDGGATWQALPVPSGVTEVHALAVDPTAPQTVYLAAASRPAGLYRSVDGGQSWQTVRDGSQGSITAVAVAAQPAHRVIIGGGGLFPSSSMAVLVSDDAGQAWREVWRGTAMMGVGAVTSLAAPTGAVLAGIITYHGGGIVIPGGLEGGWTVGQRHGPTTGFAAPAQLALGPRPGTLYARWTANGPFVLAALRKTTDSGQTWQDITPPLAGQSGQQMSQPGSATPTLTALAVDPQQAGHLFVAGKWCAKPNASGCAADGWRLVVQESRDDGATWQAVDTPLPVQEVKALVYSPAYAALVAATDQGLWRTAPGVTTTNLGVAPWFQRYYDAYDGLRLLGQPLAPPTTTDGWPAQLFEKGRVEDHSAVERDPAWKFMYGLLVDELVGARSPLPVGGDRSTLTYANLADAASEAYRLPPPVGLTRGTYTLANGSVFVPLDPKLDPAPGHTVPPIFWTYINRADLFPGGWLHDVGLPITEPLTATVDKGDALGRRITVQAFQRTVLTYDPLNPPAWRVERANVGRDYAAAGIDSR